MNIDIKLIVEHSKKAPLGELFLFFYMLQSYQFDRRRLYEKGLTMSQTQNAQFIPSTNDTLPKFEPGPKLVKYVRALSRAEKMRGAMKKFLGLRGLMIPFSLVILFDNTPETTDSINNTAVIA